MRKKRWWQVIVVSACVIAVVTAGIPVSADTISELEEELAGIQDELLALSEEITTAEMQIEILDGEIQKTQDRLEEAEAEEQKQYESMKTRIKYIYEHNSASLLALLFTAESMADFLNRAEFIRNISEYDRDTLEGLQEISREIEQEREDLETQKASMESISEKLEQNRQELEVKAEETSTDLEELRQQIEKAKGRLLESSDSNTYIVTSDEVTLLAALLDCEAEYDYSAMLAVATVVMNRVESPLFGDSISEVIYADGQFEPVWTGRLSSRLAAGPSSLALQAAQDAAGGTRLASVADCYYFLYASSANRSGVTIGNNVFFREW